MTYMFSYRRGNGAFTVRAGETPIMQTYSEYAPTGFDSAGAFLPDRQDWLVVPVMQTRDSGALDESNFAVALETLGGEGDDVEVHRFGHWGPGWFELIVVRPGTAAATTAEGIEASLEQYGVLSDDDHSTREYEAYNEGWASWGAHEFRQELERKFNLSDDDVDALEAAPDEKLQDFFEGLNDCGDYIDDGSPAIGRSVRNATAEDVADFLASLA